MMCTCIVIYTVAYNNELVSSKAATFCFAFARIWYPKRCAHSIMGFSEHSEYKNDLLIVILTPISSKFLT